MKKRSKAPHKEKTKIMLPEMITPSKKRSAEQITIDDIRSASQNDLHLKAGDGIEIRLTPKGVLLAAVDKHYGAGEDLHKFDEFMKDIC